MQVTSSVSITTASCMVDQHSDCQRNRKVKSSAILWAAISTGMTCCQKDASWSVVWDWTMIPTSGSEYVKYCPLEANFCSRGQHIRIKNTNTWLRASYFRANVSWEIFLLENLCVSVTHLYNLRLELIYVVTSLHVPFVIEPLSFTGILCGVSR